MHRAASMATWLLVAAVLCAVALVSTGELSIVETHGISMRPTYTQGDLVVVRRERSYSDGQIAAYRLPHRSVVVLHRIVSTDSAGYVFKGDNNSSLDSAHPTSAQLIGRTILHIPRGGVWLHRLTGPLCVLLLLMLVFFGARRPSRRTRSNRRSRRTPSPRSGPQLRPADHSPVVRGTAAGAVGLAALGVALGMLAWTGPVAEARSRQVASGRQVTFGYSAEVPRSPAYDDTTVNAPDPVFRKLTNDVELHVTYEGEPGSIAVAAELSTTGGWHSHVVLVPPTRFSAPRHESKVRLDLNAVSARGRAAAAASGMPVSDISVLVRATIVTDDGATFAPALALRLSPLQLAPVDTPVVLRITDAATSAHVVLVPRVISVKRWHLTASTARLVSAGSLALAVVVAGLAVFLGRREPRDEAGRILRNHAAVLARVLPIQSDDGTWVDVPEFVTLAKVAANNGLLVLHWSGGGGETYVVRDADTTYRFRTDRAAATPAHRVQRRETMRLAG